MPRNRLYSASRLPVLDPKEFPRTPLSAINRQGTPAHISPMVISETPLVGSSPRDRFYNPRGIPDSGLRFNRRLESVTRELRQSPLFMTSDR